MCLQYSRTEKYLSSLERQEVVKVHGFGQKLASFPSSFGGEKAPSCNKLHQVAPNCIMLYQSAPSCIKVHKIASNYTKLHQTAPSFTKVHQVALICTMLHQSAPSCSKMHQVASICTKLHSVSAN